MQGFEPFRDQRSCKAGNLAVPFIEGMDAFIFHLLQQEIALGNGPVVLQQFPVVRPADLGDFHVDETAPQRRAALDELQVVRREQDFVEGPDQFLLGNFCFIDPEFFLGRPG